MEFLQLKYFLSAAETENFSHTAARFYVPPSTVSASVKKLEQELGVSLFDRKANHIFLNEKGRIFRECVAGIFQSLDKTCEHLRSVDDFTGGKITMLVRTNRRLINTIISDFKSFYPNVSFILDFKEEREAKVYDLIITDQTIHRSDFEAVPLLREEICLAVHRTHPLAAKTRVKLEELSGEHFICLSKGSRLRSLTETLCKEALFTPDIAIECDDTYYVREYIRMQMGVSFVPTFSWAGQLSEEICLIPIEAGIFRESTVYRNLSSSAAASAFFDYLKERIHTGVDTASCEGFVPADDEKAVMLSCNLQKGL